MNDNLNDTSFLLASLMEYLPDNIYFKDEQSRFVLVNKAFCTWTGLSKEEILGRTDFDLFAVEHATKAYGDEQRIITTGESLLNQIEKEVWPDGKITWVSTTKMPLRNQTGAIIGTFGLSRDISASKQIEQELTKAREKAESSAMAKSIFLANMSHEIRTPLNAVVGMGELLADTELNTEQREYIGTISTSSEALLDIVDNILDLSKIEAGKLELDNEPFNLVQTVEGALDIVAPKAVQKGLELMEYFSGSVPEDVIGDAARLRQVLLNLLSNAIKFTPSGEILLEVRGEPTDTDACRISFLVSDTGIGMSPEEVQRIFRPFEQADNSITRRFGGTGLGLAICNRLIEMMGGSMTVRSEKNSGSQFSFFIVVHRTNATTPPAIPFNPAVLENRRVLIVDDNETNLKILRMETEQAGMEPLTFTSGPAALEALPELGRIDLAVLDFTMPDMDGSALAHRLRASSHFGNRPILILSSSGRPRSEAAHIVNRWMAKPVKKMRLYEALADLLEGDHFMRHEHSKTPLTAAAPRRILLVEDNRVNQIVTLKMLEKMGCKADLAENGQQAVEIQRENPYELILMDIQMPVMDGLEATRQIRSESGETPFIIGLSAHALKENRDEALACGMNDYLTKPLKLKELVRALNMVPGTPVSDGSLS